MAVATPAPRPRAAGDPIPTHCVVIAVRVTELKQLFNAIDPSPFRERDLDANAEEFIVGWAKDAPADASLALVVHLERPAGRLDEAAALKDAIHEYFTHRAEATRQRLRQLFRLGRTSLAIGVVCLASSLLLGDFLSTALSGRSFGDVLRESLLIGGWVAMWRPMEIFLYEWWPIRGEARLYDRLAVMPVRIAYASDADSEAWRRDWPAVSPAEQSQRDRDPEATPPLP